MRVSSGLPLLRATFVAHLWVVTGCHVIFPFEASPSRDDRAVRDRAVHDRAVLDHAVLDGAVLDGAVLDGSARDRASRDGVFPDLAAFDRARLDGSSRDRPSEKQADLGPPPDSALPSPDQGCGTPEQLHHTLASADACLSANTPNTSYGQAAVCFISGASAPSVGIFRFTGALPAASQITSMKVILGYAAQDNACGSSCGTCAGLETGGTLQLAFMTSNWDEATTTWIEATKGVGWLAAGATSPTERGTVVSSVMHTAQKQVQFDIPASATLLTQYATWAKASQISVQVMPSGGTGFVAATKENNTKGCATYTRPQLEIWGCP